MLETGPSRRAFLGTAGATVTTLFTGCASINDTESSPPNGEVTTSQQGETTDSEVRIGVLQPLSGALKYYGEQSGEGFFTGLSYKSDARPPDSVLSAGLETYSVGGYEFKVIVRDTNFSPEKAQTSATKLVEEEDVDVLFGCASSNAATRVLETVVESSEVPYIAGPAASASLTTDESFCRENLYRTSANTAMDAWVATRYIANLSEITSVYLFGADTSFGRAAVENYSRGIDNFGLEKAGERLVPQGHSTWDDLLRTAESAGSDAIIGGFTVATLPNLFEAFLKDEYDFQLLGNIPTKATIQAIGETIRAELGTPLDRTTLENAKIGPFVTRYHWNQYDNPVNVAFRDIYVEAYGRLPDLFTAGSFTAASAIVQAVESSEATTAEAISSTLRGMSVEETPKGTGAYTFQTFNNQARSPMTMTNYVPTAPENEETWGVPIQPGQPIARINADETTLPQDEPSVTCSL